mmetsp:Transcript_6295/g.26432  ORF Transcript_6295/g.26432 Transcript_6295/m.26432 type:complete len:290 (-) Transcript_6295:408-1277(-)
MRRPRRLSKKRQPLSSLTKRVDGGARPARSQIRDSPRCRRRVLFMRGAPPPWGASVDAASSTMRSSRLTRSGLVWSYRSPRLAASMASPSQSNLTTRRSSRSSRSARDTSRWPGATTSSTTRSRAATCTSLGGEPYALRLLRPSASTPTAGRPGSSLSTSRCCSTRRRSSAYASSEASRIEPPLGSKCSSKYSANGSGVFASARSTSARNAGSRTARAAAASPPSRSARRVPFVVSWDDDDIDAGPFRTASTPPDDGSEAYRNGGPRGRRISTIHAPFAPSSREYVGAS